MTKPLAIEFLRHSKRNAARQLGYKASPAAAIPVEKEILSPKPLAVMPHLHPN